MAVMAYFMLCIFYHNKNKGSDYTEDKERKKSREEGGEGERERLISSLRANLGCRLIK